MKITLETVHGETLATSRVESANMVLLGHVQHIADSLDVTIRVIYHDDGGQDATYVVPAAYPAWCD